MPPMLTSQRRADLVLRATDTSDDAGEPESPEPLPIWWSVGAASAGLAAAAIGWIFAVGIAVLGWLSAAAGTDAGPLGSAMGLGTRWWLLANGTGVEVGSIPVTLVPWGATALFALVLTRAVRMALRRTGPPEQDLRLRVLGPAVVATVAYFAPVVVCALLLGPVPSARSIVVLVVIGGAAAWGAVRATGTDLLRAWPEWAKPLPRAVLGAQLALLVAGAALLVVGLVTHLDRVAALGDGLHAGPAGHLALLLVQLSFLPNLIVWAASYALGAGFSLGSETTVTPAATELGAVPGFPVFGALPDPGAASALTLWWLAAGAIAGAVAGAVVVRRLDARFDLTSLVGGLAGVLSGAVFAAVAWASGGDLGTLRLAGLGPNLTQLVVMAATTLGLAGMLSGLVFGLLRRSPDVALAEQESG